MLNSKLKFPIQLAVTVFLTLGLSLSFQSLLASWTAPTDAPPGGSLPGVLNEGTGNQYKYGGLSVGGNFSVDVNDFFVDSVTGDIGIGTTSLLSSTNFTSLNINGSYGSEIIFLKDKNYAGHLSSTLVETRLAAIYSGSVLTFFANNAEYMRIIANGNVGIGTTIPAKKLDVAGDIKASGSICGSDGCANGGDITSVVAGSGLSGGGTSGDVTLSVTNGGITSAMVSDGSLTYSDINTASIQRRVGQNCPAGSYIRNIKEDGAVDCEPAGGGVDCNMASISHFTCNAITGSVMKHMQVSYCNCNSGCGSGYLQCINGSFISFFSGSPISCSRCSCFSAGTHVLMKDGSSKRIEDVVIGDKLAGENGYNTVIDFGRPYLTFEKDQRLMSINGGDFFVTDNHPIKTKEGWKSYYPESAETEAWDILHGNISQLEIGDIIITAGGNEMVVESIEIKEKTKEKIKLYNFVLDGDSTYYANGMLVMGFVPDKAGRFLIEREH